jgi:pyridoxal phosphate enzyme (YggS family)
MVDSHGDIAANLARVQARIQAAARRAGRDPAEITLVAVTKTRPLDAMQAAYRAGVRNFGENRVEEGSLKIPAFNGWAAAELPTWHMIGHLQSRKAADALAHFDMVHSVDSLKLAERLSRLAEGTGRAPLPILLECNVSGEASKYGFELSHWQASRELRLAFFDVVRDVSRLPGLHLQGLMTMAPLVAEPEQARPIFAALRLLRDALAEELPAVEWRHLSMGMTDDFEVAVEEGATLVRIGRAIFGF